MLGAVQSCLSEAGTSRASRGLGAGPVAGWLMVARASLVHQINAAATATTATIATAANTSALVRRSGLTIRRQRRRISWRWRLRPLTCGDDDGDGVRGVRPSPDGASAAGASPSVWPLAPVAGWPVAELPPRVRRRCRLLSRCGAGSSPLRGAGAARLAGDLRAAPTEPCDSVGMSSST